MASIRTTSDMSPLAYSLLALAALLVAADAQDNCNNRIIDQKSKYKVTLPIVNMHTPGGHITIEDNCKAMDPNWKAIGESVNACNNDKNGTPPNIERVDPKRLSPLQIVCVNDCPSGTTVEVVQFCKEH